MANRADREAKSNYFRREIRLRFNEWTYAERATYDALLELAAENNGIGAIRVHVLDIKDAIRDFDFDGKSPSETKVLEAITGLEQRGSVIRFPDRWLFLPDFWGMAHSMKTENHRINADRALNGIPHPIRDAFLTEYPYPMPDQQLEGSSKKEAEEVSKTAAPSTARLEPSMEPGSPGYPAFQLASDFCRDLTKMREGGMKILAPRRALQFAMGIILSEIDLLTLKRAWEWAKTDRFWKSKICNMGGFDNGALWGELANQYQSRASQTAQPPRRGPEPLEFDGRLAT